MEEEAIATTTYWCHKCTRTVDPLMEGGIKCPLCASGFVEEMSEEEEEQDSHRPNSTPLILLELTNDPALRTSNQSTVEDNQTEETENEAGGNDVDSQLQEILRRRRVRPSVSAMHLIHGSTTLEPDEDDNLIMVSAASLSDYFISPAFEALIQHLAEHDPNRYGTPPARKDAVEALTTVKIQEATSLKCSVCLDDFEIGTEAKEMPCQHRFHSGCLLQWLVLHCSCPICRYELPSDETRTDSARTQPNGSDESQHPEQEEEEEEESDDGIEFATTVQP